MPSYLAEAGAKKLSLVRPDLAGCRPADTAHQLGGAEPRAPKWSTRSRCRSTRPTSRRRSRAALANGADGIIARRHRRPDRSVRPGARSSRATKARSRPRAPFLTPASSARSASYLNGAPSWNWLPARDLQKVPGIKQYNKDMNAFDKTLNKNDQGVGNWLSTYIFEQAAAKTHEITGANISRR